MDLACALSENFGMPPYLDLALMIEGEIKLDVPGWQLATDSRGSDSTFWAAVEGLSDAERQLLLIFGAGSRSRRHSAYLTWAASSASASTEGRINCLKLTPAPSS